MSVTTNTRPVADKALFARLLLDRYERADENQLDVAEWLDSYMDDHDLEAELAEAERTASDDLRDATMDAIAVIRHYRATNAQASDYHVGPAAVSKWRNARSTPTPEKWPAVAKYMGLPLAEVHRLIEAAEMPESVVALRQHLARAAKENRDLVEDLRRIRDELARAERAQRELDEELVVLRSVARAVEETPVPVS